MQFGSVNVYSDGAVKWPRWRVTATGGFALLQRPDGRMHVAFAESAHIHYRQIAVNMEMRGLLAGVERLPPAGGVRSGIDCQMVVSGFGQRLLITDDDRSFPHALGD